jgi:hypothetical protein
MRIKIVFILFSFLLMISLSLQSQTVTNTTAISTNKPTLRPLTPSEAVYFTAQGIDPTGFTTDAPLPPQPPQQPVTPTPLELKNAIVYMDSFLGMTNTMLPADVISMKPQSLKFRINGQDYDYSGNYTVMLNTPRQHKNPYFGIGSPETAKLVTLQDFGGNMWPLQNATIWEKKVNYIDVVALDKEWIYSGTYTIQNW